MKTKIAPQLLAVILVLLLAMLACNMPTNSQTQGVTTPGVPTAMADAVSTAIAGAPNAASTVVAKVTGPEYPEPPDYPTDGIPPAGIYKAPPTDPSAWYYFPKWPDNTSVNPLSGQNPGNCGMDKDWTFCSYTFGWQTSLMGPNNAVGINMRPADYTGYMIIDSAVTGGISVQTYEATSVAVSDGTTVVVIKIVRDMLSTNETFTYQFGYYP